MVTLMSISGVIIPLKLYLTKTDKALWWQIRSIGAYGFLSLDGSSDVKRDEIQVRNTGR